MCVCVRAGQVWSWGDGDYGKLGRGGSDGCKTPKLVEKLQDLDIVKVCCGSQFSLALTKDGQVYTWGKGDNQRLGHGTDEHVRYPKLLDSLQGESSLYLLSKEVVPYLYSSGPKIKNIMARLTISLIYKPR